MIKKAQWMFRFENYWDAGLVARQSLQKHRISRRACVCYINWANGEFTEQEIANKLGISQPGVVSMIANIRKVWRHLPGKPPNQPMAWEVKQFNLEEHVDIVLKV